MKRRVVSPDIYEQQIVYISSTYMRRYLEGLLGTHKRVFFFFFNRPARFGG